MSARMTGCLAVALAVTMIHPAQAQQAEGQQGAGHPLAASPAAASGNAMAPSWIPLPAKHQQYLDQVLAYWEYKSSQIKRYRCAFRRWEYDPVFGPRDTFNTFSEGVIKYSAPDKGLFRVETLKQYKSPERAGEKPRYEESGAGHYDHWICDGQWIYYFDHQRKKLVQSQLPPDMRGKAISRGPLPFLFNAQADDIQRRFWLRVITPKGVEDEYHLEAVPRTQEDAANFKMIHVIIDRGDYLPKAMVVFDRNFSPQTPTRTTYEFNHREVNFSILAEKLNLFHREFFEPAVPNGWKKDVRKWNEPVAPPGPTESTARGPSAARASR